MNRRLSSFVLVLGPHVLTGAWLGIVTAQSARADGPGLALDLSINWQVIFVLGGYAVMIGMQFAKLIALEKSNDRLETSVDNVKSKVDRLQRIIVRIRTEARVSRGSPAYDPDDAADDKEEVE